MDDRDSPHPGARSPGPSHERRSTATAGSVAAAFRDELASASDDDSDESVTYGARFASDSPELALLESLRSEFDLNKSEALRLVVRLSIGQFDDLATVEALATDIDDITHQLTAIGDRLDAFEAELETLHDRLDRIEMKAGATFHGGSAADQSSSDVDASSTADGSDDPPSPPDPDAITDGPRHDEDAGSDESDDSEPVQEDLF